MERDLISHLRSMHDAPDVLTLRRAVLAFTKSFGFRSAFFLSPIARDARSGRVLTNVGFSHVWERAYRRGLYLVDPLPKVALNQSTSFFWVDVPQIEDISERGKRYLGILAQHGMENGVIIPTYGPGTRCGLMGLGHNDRLDEIGSDALAALQAGVQASYARYCDLLTAELEAGDPLSNREIDVLYWITQGKCNSSIGVILDISPQTVDTYVRRIFAKLNVADRTGAAVSAIQRGIFVAGYYRAQSEVDEEA